VKPGWFLLAYDDGESIWTRLTEGDFNCARIGSWRLDLDPILPVAPDADGGAEAGPSGGGEVSESESEYEEEEGGFESEEESDEEQGE